MSACHSDEEGDTPAPRAMQRLIPQVAPPLDLEKPPAEAIKTASGLVYKKLGERDAGARPARSDKVLVHYTGWRQGTGDTFFTTKGRGQPIALDVAHAAPSFREVLPLLGKGERAMFWVPPGPGTAGTLVYEVEVVDFVTPPRGAG